MFFVLGSNLADRLDVAARMLRAGHTLGNHTYSHARPGTLTQAALTDEIERTDGLIRQAHFLAGLPLPNAIPLRLPYGVEPDDQRLVVLERLGRPHTGWTALSEDWRRPQPAARELFQTMLCHIDSRRHLESVLCLHDSSRHGEARPATVEAVRLLLASRRPGATETASA